jgi:DNA-binding response OmpR family regulator
MYMDNAGQENLEPDGAAREQPLLGPTSALRGSVRPLVMIVDDDRELIDLLIYSMHRAGMDVAPVLDASHALLQFDALQPDLVLMELMLSRCEGFRLLGGLRRRSEVPIVILSALRSEDDKVRGLELGADDYVTKPFSHVALISSIRAQLRLAGHGWLVPDRGLDHLVAGPLTLDMAEHKLIKAGRSVDLTPLEFRLLAALMANAGRVLPAEAIMGALWEHADEISTTTLHVLVHRLRRKLEDVPAQPMLLQTVARVGFRLASVPSEDPRERSAGTCNTV